MKLTRFFLSSALMLACGSAMAWTETGHMVICRIAYSRLSPAVKLEVDRLAALGDDPRSSDFVTASTWADDVKRKRPTSAPWHFINLHFWSDGHASANQPAPENVVAAIKRFSAVLGDRSKPDIERAEALRWLLHFVGDVHQPLHSCARDTNDHPYGDKGGNEFEILPPAGISPAPKNLHFLWDLGGGLFPGTRRPLTATGLGRIERLAQDFIDKNGAVAEKSVSTMDPMKWAQEGLGIAKTSVYSGIEEGGEPSEEYLTLTREVSGLRVTIAGFRLAKLLNSSLSK